MSINPGQWLYPWGSHSNDSQTTFLHASSLEDHDLAGQPLSPNHFSSPFYGGIVADTISLADVEEYKPVSRF